MQHSEDHTGSAGVLPPPFSEPPPFHPGPPVRIWDQLDGRGPALQPSHVRDLYLDPQQWRAWRGALDLNLTRTEFALLWALATTPGRPWSRLHLIQEIWSAHDPGPTSLVAVCIRRLRRKLEPDPAHPTYIRTVITHGYLLAVDS